MATTINGTTSSPSYWVFKIVVTENSTSITNNTSSVTVEAFIGRSSERETSSYLQRPEISCSVGITGCANQTISYSNSGRIDLAPGEWLSIGSTTFSSVPHNDDGSKTVTVSASFTSDVSPSSGSASGGVTLTTIPRKSTLSVSNSTLGTAQTLTVTRKSTSFTHTITATCGSASTTVCTKSSSTSISFTPPLSWASQNTTGTSVSVTYTITTYNGSTSVGSNSYTVSCTIPSSVKPSVAISISDAMGYASTYGGYIKGLSKFKIVLTPTTSYGSAIASYKVTANGSSYTSSTVTTDVIKTSGTLTISASVTDKRGRSGSASTTATVLNYTAPTISLLKVNRCNSDGTENNQGEYVKVTYSGTVTSLNSKNTAKWVLYYKKSTASSYSSVTLSTGTTFTMSNSTKVIAADTGSSYNIKLSITDNFTTTSSETVASTAFTMMHFNAAGNGMAIGKIAETENLFDVGMNARFNGDVDAPSIFSKVSNPNLLINGDFQVWQRGTSFNETTTDTSHNCRYTADRWWTYYEGNSFTVKKGDNGGLVISANQGIFQILETNLEIGETYTLSAKVDDKIITLTFVGGTYVTWNGLQYRAWREYECIQVLGDVLAERTIYWVKLEKSSVATPFVPRLFAEELVLCERYHHRYERVCLWSRNGTDFNGFPLRTVMRTIPSLAAKNYTNSGGSDITGKSTLIAMNQYTFQYVIFGENVGTIIYVDVVFDAEIY